LLDSKKILSLAEQLYEVDKAIGQLNGGMAVRISFSDGKTEGSIVVPANADDKKSCALSTEIDRALGQYRMAVQKDFREALRAH
jgi:hypothetical protein